ncbi:hypothetical protein [Mesorhizobium sp. NPDC059025]|uniref:DUF7683 domain-containing protein n=1 Tax=unclassified Mesorhizobium TaxID=325217 RepID=UPI0036A306CF
MIVPPPSAQKESELPPSAIDVITYPPYKLIWCLEKFNKQTELLVAEVVLKDFDVRALRRIYRRPPSDSMIEGGWPITGRVRGQIEALIGHKMNLKQHSCFIAASAVNYNEVNRSHV